jgi:WD40 repeat protein
LVLLATPAAADEPAPRLDRYGDPLPDGAVARLGTARFRHDYSVGSVLFYPDGKSILALSGPGLARPLSRWDAATGRELPAPRAPLAVYAAAFSPDGRTLVTASEWLTLWDAAAGARLRDVRDQGLALAVAFSPDGRRVAAGGHDRTLRVWEVATGRELLRVGKLPTFSGGLAFAPGGRAVAATHDDGTVRVFDAGTGAEAWRVADRQDKTGLAFSPDGKVLATAGRDGSLRLSDAATGKELRASPAAGADAVSTLAFAPDGRTLATGGNDGTVRVWDVRTCKELRRWRSAPCDVQSAAFAPDGRTLATASRLGSAVRLWDPATGRELVPTEGHRASVRWLGFAPGGKTLFSLGYDRRAFHWDLAARRGGERFGGPDGWPFDPAALSPDGRTMATAEGKGGAVRLWDAAAGKELAAPGRHAGGTRALAFSPGGEVLASGGEDCSIALWDVGRGKQVRRLEGLKDPVGHLLFSPDGSVLASAAYAGGAPGERGVRLWDVATGRPLRHLDDPCTSPELAFTADGRFLAVAQAYVGQGVRVYDVATGKERFRGLGNRDAHGPAFSADGRLLAAGCGEQDNHVYEVVVWETATWREVRRFRGHHGGAMCLAFAPDHRTLASGGADSTILLWDLAAGRGPATPEACWADLRGDAAVAYPAVWALASSPSSAVPLLRERLRAAALPAEVDQLVADLDADSFAARERAAKALARHGHRAVPALRRLLAGRPSPEARRAAERLLEAATTSPEALQAARGVQALEYAGTADARRALAELAAGPAETRVTQESRAALRRLEK